MTGWICLAVTALGAGTTLLWFGFLAGRRYESGIWERWVEYEDELQEKQAVKRGVTLRRIKVSR